MDSTGAPLTVPEYKNKPQRGRGRPPLKRPGVPVRDVREAQGLTLAALQERTGISPAIWSQIERGRLLPEPQHIAALSTALGVQPGEWRIRFILELEVPA